MEWWSAWWYREIFLAEQHERAEGECDERNVVEWLGQRHVILIGMTRVLHVAQWRSAHNKGGACHSWRRLVCMGIHRRTACGTAVVMVALLVRSALEMQRHPEGAMEHARQWLEQGERQNRQQCEDRAITPQLWSPPPYMMVPSLAYGQTTYHACYPSQYTSG